MSYEPTRKRHGGRIDHGHPDAPKKRISFRHAARISVAIKLRTLTDTEEEEKK